MKFTFIGTGTAAPISSLRPSSIYFEFEDLKGLLDLGAGAVHGMAGYGIDPMHVSNVFFSHYHSDHVSDLIMLLHSNNATPGKVRHGTLNLYGPPGLQKLADTITGLFPETVPEEYEMNIQEENSEKAVIADGVTVRCFPTGHTSNSIAHRFAYRNKFFVYTGDCAFSSGLCGFCEGTDALITECSYADDRRTEDHLCVQETARLAEKAGAKKLIIVHRYPDTAAENIIPEIKEIYTGLVYIPSEGETLLFG